MREPRVLLLTTAIACVGASMARTSEAHPTAGSVVSVEFERDSLKIDHDAPAREVARAAQLAPAPDARALVARDEAAIASYARERVAVAASATSHEWTLRSVRVVAADVDDDPRVHFMLTFHAPRDEHEASIRLADELLTRELPAHTSLVFVRRDWSNGVVGDEPRLAGVVRGDERVVTIARQGSTLRGVTAVAQQGMRHIAEGTDHLLFLLMLVLPAPLEAEGRRWTRHRPLRAALLRLAGTVTAFTFGHSVTLALAAIGLVHARASVVEPLVAASILVAAAHAVRPLARRGEAWIAAGFGLLHGLAFASALRERDVRGPDAAWTLVGFNLGIELQQLFVLACVVPWILLMARTRMYRGVRVAFAAVGATLALVWVAERVASWHSPLSSVVEGASAHPAAMLATLAFASVSLAAYEAASAARR